MRTQCRFAWRFVLAAVWIYWLLDIQMLEAKVDVSFNFAISPLKWILSFSFVEDNPIKCQASCHNPFTVTVLIWVYFGILYK